MPENQQIQQSKRPNTSFQKQATPVIQTPASNPFSIIQRAKINPKSLTHADVMQLQRTIGNRAVGMLLSGLGNTSTAQQAPVQRQEIPEEEEPLQGKFEDKPEIACPSCFAAPVVQRQEIPEEEEPLQGKMIGTIQRQEIPEEEEPLQGKMAEAVQRQEIPEEEEPLQTKRENNTGMPDNLKAGVESLSGIDISDVRVHYNSDKPAEVGALAYTQGIDIHVAQGQEKHLPHEAWHVVQQVQGRVRPTMQLKDGIPVNDDKSLEHEADVMGLRAQNERFKKVNTQQKLNGIQQKKVSVTQTKRDNSQGIIQIVRLNPYLRSVNDDMHLQHTIQNKTDLQLLRNQFNVIQKKAINGFQAFGDYIDVDGNGTFGTTTPTDGIEVAELVKEIRRHMLTSKKYQIIVILSGNHGDPYGNLYQHGGFYIEDLANEGKGPVKINTKKVPLKSKKMLESDVFNPNIVKILGWCYSSVSYNNWNTIIADWPKWT